MNLELHREMYVADVQHQFEKFYPFLKLEFYKSSADKILLKPINKKLSWFGMHNLETQWINISAIKTIANIIDELEKKYELHAAIFRKSGNVWIEITETKDWTLQQQNEEGKLFEKV